jgi:hypothetical protein
MVLNYGNKNMALNRAEKGNTETKTKHFFIHFLIKLGCESVYWFYLAIKKMVANFLNIYATITFSKGLCIVDVVLYAAYSAT